MGKSGLNFRLMELCHLHAERIPSGLAPKNEIGSFAFLNVESAEVVEEFNHFSLSFLLCRIHPHLFPCAPPAMAPWSEEISHNASEVAEPASYTLFPSSSPLPIEIELPSSARSRPVGSEAAEGGRRQQLFC